MCRVEENGQGGVGVRFQLRHAVDVDAGSIRAHEGCRWRRQLTFIYTYVGEGGRRRLGKHAGEDGGGGGEHVARDPKSKDGFVGR